MQALLALALAAAPATGQPLAARLHADAAGDPVTQTHRRAILDLRRLGSDDRPFPAHLPPGGPVYRWPAAGKVRGDADGTRLATLPGAPALAPASGRVAYAGPFRTYGDVLILDHGHGWTTVLTGLATIGVGQGAALAGGETIGTTSDALDLRLLHHGRSVDAAKLIAFFQR